MQERDLKEEMISFVGQLASEVPENKKLANKYIQLTRNRGLEFQKERRTGGCKFQEALR